MNGFIFLLASVLALALIGTWVILRHAKKCGLVKDSNHRSSHVTPTPVGGGLAIAIAFTVTGIWLTYGEFPLLMKLIGLAIPLALCGLIDDIKPLPAPIRLGVQTLICAGWLIALPSPEISIGNIVFYRPAFFCLVLLAGVWWINLFNFMDGIDGIAGAQAVFMLAAGALLAAWASPEATDSPVWKLMLFGIAATVGFLLFNWPPAKIFMGDTGSTWLGFIIFALALLTIQSGWLSNASWLVLGAVFVTDTTVTLLRRMTRGERWYEAHCCHAYQKLGRHWKMDRKAGHRSVTLLVTAVNLLWLTPLAWCCLLWPGWSPVLVSTAYAPLVLAVVWLGAGIPDKPCKN